MKWVNDRGEVIDPPSRGCLFQFANTIDNSEALKRRLGSSQSVFALKKVYGKNDRLRDVTVWVASVLPLNGNIDTDATYDNLKANFDAVFVAT